MKRASLLSLSALALPLHAADLTWNNATPGNAVFHIFNATVTLTQAITGGSLTSIKGAAPSGAHELTLAGRVLAWKRRRRTTDTSAEIL